MQALNFFPHPAVPDGSFKKVRDFNQPWFVYSTTRNVAIAKPNFETCLQDGDYQGFDIIAWNIARRMCVYVGVALPIGARVRLRSTPYDSDMFAKGKQLMLLLICSVSK